jgi:hypothetical protein
MPKRLLTRMLIIAVVIAAVWSAWQFDIVGALRRLHGY